eukprot:TRINITY_DN4472_c0_g2_i1.p1 TRINITY_DN4472_c0_g2~~TRINITY_DN4472_c0_g2_i1.p1  ORF type:complete len:246 (+),score=33.23 TRINITY_DN4472_c0_g2_i1:286-1023(+)
MRRDEHPVILLPPNLEADLARIEKTPDHSGFVGMWTRFQGCGTNGGTATTLCLSEDLTGWYELTKVSGASSMEGDVKEPAVNGSWRFLGQDMVEFTPFIDYAPYGGDTLIFDEWGGRYGFCKMDDVQLDVQEEARVEKTPDHSGFVGMWTRFQGCGTNGGTATTLCLSEDLTGWYELTKVSGASSMEGDVKEPAVNGSWRFLGQDMVEFTPFIDFGPYGGDTMIFDEWGGRYGFCKMDNAVLDQW